MLPYDGSALVKVDGLELEDIATRSMDVASEICVYTNGNYTMESVTLPDPEAEEAAAAAESEKGEADGQEEAEKDDKN